jgi:hypothetical protein
MFEEKNALQMLLFVIAQLALKRIYNYFNVLMKGFLMLIFRCMFVSFLFQKIGCEVEALKQRPKRRFANNPFSDNALECKFKRRAPQHHEQSASNAATPVLSSTTVNQNSFSLRSC